VTKWPDNHAESQSKALLRILDQDFYRKRAGLPPTVDAAEHHLSRGWREGLEPNPFFEGAFLSPYYNTVPFDQPPALTWLELESMGGPTPSNRLEAETLASEVRKSDYFDAKWYERNIPKGLDPALHYVVLGEQLGWRPSPSFDPSYYREKYPDIASNGISPLLHYSGHGRREGRRPTSVAEGLTFPLLGAHGKPIVLLISHDASRTGAPILGWNLARALSDRYRIVSLIMHGGILEADFAKISAAVIGPLTHHDWHLVEMSRLAERLIESYRPVYAIANSVETYSVVPPLVARGIPTVALVHEFAAYTRPLERMRNIYDWASHVVFPARIVAESSFRAFPDLKGRACLHYISQGPPQLPSVAQTSSRGAAIEVSPHALADVDSFIVLGAGTVEIRKGQDLFISAASTVKQLHPDANVRFLWIGDGYDPVNDAGYSSYLAEQIVLSGLEGRLTMIPSVEDLNPYYDRADVFFICSRLDPQPNVGIDAVTRGIPTVCFEKACGTAEVLAADPATRRLVVPHLDAHLAAVEICRLWEERNSLTELRAAVANVGRRAFDMKTYVDRIDELGLAASSGLSHDFRILLDADAIDPALLLPPGGALPMRGELERIALLRWRLWNSAEGSLVHPQLRRPCAGFHPQAYAHAHAKDCVDGGRDPFAHWLSRGRPLGPWSHRVFTPSSMDTEKGQRQIMRIALHGHFYYPDLATDLRRRLARNATRVDLFLTTDEEAKVQKLRNVFKSYPATVSIRVVTNRGRDIAPFITDLATEIVGGGYDVFGHIHGKRSLVVGGDLGNAWRKFLWDNLIGEEHCMLDLAASVFFREPSVGLVFAEDPHLVAWNANRDIAEQLAVRMGISIPLDEFFDFPLGTMFWTRPAALQPLLDLDLSLSDFPEEPVPYDGTILHALERLMPFIAKHAGFELASLRAPDTTW
jgi:glycosyltransferase involved in cell wall biosynthesis